MKLVAPLRGPKYLQLGPKFPDLSSYPNESLFSFGPGGDLYYKNGSGSAVAVIGGIPVLTYTGDVTGSGSSSVALTLSASGVTAGTYKSVTVDSKGRVTGGTNPTTLAGYGITDAAALTHTHILENLSNVNVGTKGNTDVLQWTGLAWVNTPAASIVGSKVDSFNTRSGAVTLLSTDVTNALGFTPYNSTNPSGYITGNQTITVTGDVTGSGTTAITLSLPNVVTAGTYKSVTVDTKGRVTAGTNPTSLSGYGITDAQPLDADLTSIAALAGTSGLLKKTAVDTWSLDTTVYVTGVTATAPVDSSGGSAPVISMAAATASVNGYMTSTYAAKLDGIAAGANNYTLPVASATVLGGVKQGTNISIDASGVISTPTITAASVGLGNVDDTSDLNKPISTATQTALNLKANLNSPVLVTPNLGNAIAASINGLAFNSLANGFSIGGGTASATLTVPASGSVSGTNTGDQTITLTGGVTGSGTGTFAATVVTNANLTGMVTSVGNATTVVTNANLTGDVTSVGNATTVVTNANLTGDVTSVGNATTIGTNKVILSNLAQIASGTFLARTTAGTGNVEALSAAQVAALLPVFGTSKGLVPGVVSNTTDFLRADGTFATPPNSGGTVTSVTATSPVQSTGGNTPVISMPAATELVAGYLLSADWTTFNAKAPTDSPYFSGIVHTGALDAYVNTGTLDLGTNWASIVNLGTAATTQTVNIGTGAGVTTINIGGAGDTVNISGTLVYNNVTNMTVTDKLITLNKGGAAASGDSAGIEIEEGGSITGYAKIGNTRSSWSFLAPGKLGTILLTPSATAFSSEVISTATAARQFTLPDASGTFAMVSDLTAKEPTITGGTSAQYWNGLKAWTDFNTSVRGATLTGLVAGANTPIAATDSVLTAFQNVQAQLNNKQVSGSYQALDGDLTAIANLAGTSGFLKKTAADTWALDTTTYSTTNGTVTTLSVVSANGFGGSVANAGTTPAITLTTSISGMLKGSGSALVAATAGVDYSAGTSALGTGILKSTTTTGALTIAVAADFPILNQSTTGNAATVTNGVYTTSTNVVTNAMSAQMAANTLKGNNTGLTANAADLTVAQIKTLLAYVPSDIGAPTTTGTGASGNWGISITGSAASATNATNVGVTNDTTTATAFSLVMVDGSTGNLAPKVSASRLYFYPATGTLVALAFSGSGASLTNIPNGALTNSSVTVGSTAIALGATSTTLAGLTSVTSTTFVGALTGNATTATTATNITGGAAGSIPYQTGSGATTMLATGSGVLVGGATPSYSTAPTLTGTNFTGIPESGVSNLVTDLAAKAAVGQTFYLGTTQIAINRVSGSIALTGITSIDGNAATVTTNANLTGMVTSVGNATTVVTNANLTGDVTSVGNATTLAATTVTGKVLTNYTLGTATAVAATDSILTAFGKLQAQVTAAPGTVTTLSVATANGFAGSVASATSSPVITLSTSISGLLKGNGTAISAATAADYVAPGTAPTLTGTNFTSIPNGALSNSSVTIGSTAVALGATTTTLAGLTSVTATTFTGVLSGNASTATTAGTVTTAAQPAITSVGTLTTLNVDFANIDTYTLTSTATTAGQQIASIPQATFRSAEFQIQAVDATGGKYQTTKILAVHNGSTSADYTEFGSVQIGGQVGAFSVVADGTNMKLLVTPTSANSSVFKVAVTAITI